MNIDINFRQTVLMLRLEMDGPIYMPDRLWYDGRKGEAMWEIHVTKRMSVSEVYLFRPSQGWHPSKITHAELVSGDTLTVTVRLT